MADRAPPLGQQTVLYGRADECQVLDSVAAAVRRSEGRALVLRGEAGIGKTGLLRYLRESASDLTLLQAVGVESEMELAHAGLQQLCVPMLDRLERLPDPQRQALEVVFGLVSGPGPDRFLVGLGALSLLSEVAGRRPLLCVVDDAQWLDQASAWTLAFVARRLQAEPIGIVFATREPSEELRDIDELRVRGLRDEDARALLGSVVRVKLDEQVRDRVIAETHGNPLALLELPRGLTATELAGGFGLTGELGVAGRIEERFLQRLNALPDAGRLLLVLAAADPVGDPIVLRRAAKRLGIHPEVVEDPASIELLTIRERVIFRHPLVRSAAYQAAPDADRRAAHQALADATDREMDPDRRAWHLAAASPGANEEVALELERSADRAQARGGPAAAAAFLRRAAALSEQPSQRAKRSLAAAQGCFRAGEFEDAVRLIDAAMSGPLAAAQRAQAGLLRGHIAVAAGSLTEAPSLLMKAAGALEEFDVALARETYLHAWFAATIAGHAADAAVRVEICRAISAMAPDAGGPTALSLLVDGLALLTMEGPAAATPTLQRAAEAIATIPVDQVLRWGWLATNAANAVWDIEGMRALSARHVRLVRDVGALAELPIHLWQLGIATAWMGDFADAALLISQSDAVASAMGSQIAPYPALRLAALRGDEAEVSALSQIAAERAAATGQGIATTHASWAQAVLNNGLARYAEAEDAARRALTTPKPWLSTVWSLPELVEAAARRGAIELAHHAFDQLAETTQPCGHDFALGMQARCRALLEDGEAAETLYDEAIVRLARTPLRPELARAHLLYGEWLRRQNRRAEGRKELRIAHKQLDGMGMRAFADRARRELRATGETVRKRKVETHDELTAQEAQIAQFARDGLSNPEIGLRLFISPRTVEYHLRHVFSKLHIRSRYELATALEPRSSTATQAHGA